MKHACLSIRRVVIAAALALVAMAVWPFLAEAGKPQPAVVASWHGAPSSVPLNRVLVLTLRVESAENTSNVTVELLPTAGVQIVGGTSPWTGALSMNQVLELPVRMRVVANGEWTLGASITNRRPKADVQVSGAVLSVVARNGVATLSVESPAASKLSSAQTAEERRRLGVAETSSTPAPARRRRSP